MTDAAAQLFKFNGGLHLTGNKTISSDESIRICPVGEELVLPVSQHIGTPGDVLVSVGDHVLKGQPVTRPHTYISASIHASTSGTVTAIEKRRIPHASGLEDLCVVIKPDGKDDLTEDSEPVVDFASVDPAQLRALVRNGGIVGLGGAVFPTAVKLDAASDTGLETLVLNGAECEPYISCDYALMQDHAESVVFGAEVLMHALQVSHCIIATEDQYSDVVTVLRQAVEAAADPRIELITVPTIYPAGGEKQLLQVLIGKEVPHDGLPADIGCVVQNVGTAAAVANLMRTGEPLISRIVTVTGKGVANPCNIRVRIGTPIARVIEACGGYTDDAARLIMGGAMMGVALSTDEVPVVKATNCILVAGKDEIRSFDDEMPCIRCGDCARVCPAALLPQQLFWHIQAADFEQVERHHLFDCIECGCCDFVCPSHIPLTQNFRFAKTEIWAREREHEKAVLARERFTARTDRLDRDKTERRARLEAKKSRLAANEDEDDKKKVIAEVMERVRARESDKAGSDEG